MCVQGLEGHRRLGAVAGEARRRRAVAEQHRSSAAALLCSADAWGQLTGGPQLPETIGQKDSALFLVLCATLKIYKWSCVDHKFVN